MENLENLIVEDAKIAVKNFSGKETQYSRNGIRYFCLLLDPDTAVKMTRDGWKVKTFKLRAGEDVPQSYIQVEVRFNAYPPKIVMVTKTGKIMLNEETVGMLDWTEIAKIDLVVRPRYWETGSASGIKAYLKTMYVTIEEDEFEGNYNDVPWKS